MRERLTSWFKRLPFYLQVGIAIMGILVTVGLGLIAAIYILAYIFFVGAASVTCNNCGSNFNSLLVPPIAIVLILSGLWAG